MVRDGGDPKEKICDAIRQEREKRGHTPKVTEVRESQAPEFPDHTEYFDSWECALATAGVMPGKEEIIESVKELNEELEDVPNSTSFLDHTHYRRIDYLHHFDSWSEVEVEAGFLLTELAIKIHAQQFTSVEGRSPSLSEFKQFHPNSRINHLAYYSGWEEALEVADVLPTQQEIIQQISNFKSKNIGFIKQSEFICSENIGNHEIEYHFDSWEDALEAANALPDKEDLISIVQETMDKQGAIVSRRDIYEETPLEQDYHLRFFESWKKLLEAANGIETALPKAHIERVQEFTIKHGRPPSEGYADDVLDLNTTVEVTREVDQAFDWETILRSLDLDPGETDPVADLSEEIEQLAETLEHRPNVEEVRGYITNDSDYTVSRQEVQDAIEEAQAPSERDLAPTRSLTRQRYDSNVDSAPSHTDLLVELNVLRARGNNSKPELESAFEDSGVVDERHFDIQFGGLSEAISHLFSIDVSTYREPIERNLSLTSEMLSDSVHELGDILGRRPLLEEVVLLGESSIADFVNSFESWEEVSDKTTPVRSWTNDELLADLETVGRELGKPPSHREVIEFGSTPGQCHLRRFGSWPSVLKLLGVDIDTIPEEYIAYEFTCNLWDTTDYLVREEFAHKDALLDEVHRLAFELNSSPTRSHLQKYSPYSVSKFDRAFDSLEDTIRRMDITVHDPEASSTMPTRDELRKELDKVGKSVTRWVLPHEICHHSKYTLGTFLGVFGSLESALDSANLATDHFVGPTTTYSDAWHAEHQMKAGILQDIRHLAARSDDSPTMSRLESVAGISQNVVYRFFDNWDEAKRAAGVEDSPGSVDVTPGEVDNPDFVDDLLGEMDDMMVE